MPPEAEEQNVSQTDRQKAQDACDRRNAIIKEMKELRAKAKDAGQEDHGKIIERFNRLDEEYEKLDQEEKRHLGLKTMDERLSEIDNALETPTRGYPMPDLDEPVTGDERLDDGAQAPSKFWQKRMSVLQRRAQHGLDLQSQIALGLDGQDRFYRARRILDEEDQEAGRALRQIEERAFCKWALGERLEKFEMRVLTASDPDQGGTLFSPMVFGEKVLIRLDQMLVFRQHCEQVYCDFGQSFGSPTIETDPSEPDFTPEVGTVPEDSSTRTGARILHAHDLTKLIKLSVRLMRSKKWDVLNIIVERLTRMMAQAKARAYMTGSGISEPLGIFRQSPSGIDTTRDVESDVEDGPSYDFLCDMEAQIDPQWRINAKWVANQAFYTKCRKLTDGVHRPLWEENVKAGEPKMLLGYPIVVDPYAPSSFAAESYICVLGDLMFYQLLDVMQPEVVFYDKQFRTERKFGYQIEDGADGMPVFKEAFARGQLPAAS